MNKIFKEIISAPPVAGFPYKEKFCRHCEHEMSLMKVVHMEEMEHYKALYICENPLCKAYDFPARKAHAHVYYSSEVAFQNLELNRIMYQREEKGVDKIKTF
jgi:hypothetical protein